MINYWTRDGVLSHICLKGRHEWPTFGLIIGCYAGFLSVTAASSALGAVVTLFMLAPLIALHSSLQHEVLHGHPLRSQWASDALVVPALGLFVPYLRFKDLHLAHHYDPALTDPYDDPESNFIDPEHWKRLPGWLQSLLSFNNTLLGRMLVGPAKSLFFMYAQDARSLWRGEKRVWLAYSLHVAGLLPVVLWLTAATSVSLWLILASAYMALSILQIRTFLEHRAHERAGGRSVIIEDRGILALLFLNNNYHAVHHAYPRLAWHHLPARFLERRDDFLRRNGGYVYRSYLEIFCRYLLRQKDPVPHPLLEVTATPTHPAGDVCRARKPANV